MAADAGSDRSPTPPRWLHGVWRRHGRITGRDVSTATPDGLQEISNALWIQAGRYFADVRVPTDAAAGGRIDALDRAQAFSGFVSCRRHIIIWCHDLDSLGRPLGYEDRATIRRDGADTMWEKGTGYLELWKRDTQQGGAAAVFERRDTRSGTVMARLIASSELAVSVWGGPQPGGAVLRLGDDGWKLDASVGTLSVPWAAVASARRGRATAGWHRVA